MNDTNGRTVPELLKYIGQYSHPDPEGSYRTLIVQEISSETNKLHLQGLMEVALDDKKFDKRMRNAFRYKFPLPKGEKNTGKFSLSCKWESTTHQENYTKYLCKDITLENPVVVNTMFTDQDLTDLIAAYHSDQADDTKATLYKAKKKKVDVSKDYLVYMKAQTSYIKNDKIYRLAKNCDMRSIVKLTIHYIFGLRQARNGSESVIRGYVLLALYNLPWLYWKGDYESNFINNVVDLINMPRTNEYANIDYEVTHLCETAGASESDENNIGYDIV